MLVRMTTHRADPAPPGPGAPAMLALSELLGRKVADARGRPLGRLRDLGVSLAYAMPGVTCVYVGDRRSPWAVRSEVDVDGNGRVAPLPAGEGSAELLLARDVLDRQVYDAAGRRLTRVGDVVLDHLGDRLAVVGIDTGAGAILRRLGLGRLARRRVPLVVAWPDLHLLSGPGHELQLRSPTAVVHRLDDTQLVELFRRASVGQGEAVLAALHEARRSDVGTAVSRSAPRRRSTDPLSARKHAPA